MIMIDDDRGVIKVITMVHGNNTYEGGRRRYELASRLYSNMDGYHHVSLERRGEGRGREIGYL